MRLIDADKLILHLNDYALQESPGNEEPADDRKISAAAYKSIMDCIKAAELQPTAHDDTGLKDINGNRIQENDILMCHGNSNDLVKAVFGEFGVRNIETGTVVDNVIGWHYEIVPTDEISRCEPFCYSMPLTKEYIKRCGMEVVNNPELLLETTE
mgnify:CR=1 FL=1